MLNWLDPDPTMALLDALTIVAAVLLAVWLVPRRARRVRRHGGQTTAVAVTVVGTLCLSASLLPGLVSQNASVMLLIIGLGITFQPEAIVRLSGGPTAAWSALRAGMELQRLLADWPDRTAALRNPGVVDALAALEAARSPTTATYVDAVLEATTAEVDPSEAGERVARIAQAEATLRRSLWGRPSFERSVARRPAST